MLGIWLAFSVTVQGDGVKPLTDGFAGRALRVYIPKGL